MVFEGLSEKLQSVIKKIRGAGRVTEKDVKAMMREVKLALLEADVNFKVVKDFIAKVSERAVGQDVLDSLTPGQQVVKIVHENLILYGPVGTGKSHMATAIGVAACSRGKKVKFYRTAALVNLLSEAKVKGELQRFMKQLRKTDLLICDEWGYIPFEKDGSQLLFQVISECYEKRSVIITTNLEFSKWNGIFYDEKLTSAIIDRLVHHSHLLIFQGQSYRLTHSTMKSH
jgi:DNA replication protein DnaC